MWNLWKNIYIKNLENLNSYGYFLQLLKCKKYWKILCDISLILCFWDFKTDPKTKNSIFTLTFSYQVMFSVTLILCFGWFKIDPKIKDIVFANYVLLNFQFSRSIMVSLRLIFIFFFIDPRFFARLNNNSTALIAMSCLCKFKIIYMRVNESKRKRKRNLNFKNWPMSLCYILKPYIIYNMFKNESNIYSID